MQPTTHKKTYAFWYDHQAGLWRKVIVDDPSGLTQIVTVTYFDNKNRRTVYRNGKLMSVGTPVRVKVPRNDLRKYPQ